MFALARGLAFSFYLGRWRERARDFSSLSFFSLFLFLFLLFVRSFLGNTRNLVLIEFKQGSAAAAAVSVGATEF